MIVLSLFDGMSCGQLALQKAGIKVDKYFASEIDKHAIQVTQHNFPNTIQLGDVTKVFAKDLPKIDLLIGGSPCQGFSFAGKQLAFDDPRSKLFFEFVRLKNECNPTYFLLENVKMKKEFEIIISKYMGVAPIEINSALLSAQNRARLYWLGQIRERLYYNDNLCYFCLKKENEQKRQSRILGEAQRKGTEQVLGEAQERQSGLQNLSKGVFENREAWNNTDLLGNLQPNKQKEHRQEQEQGAEIGIPKKVSKRKSSETFGLSKEISTNTERKRVVEENRRESVEKNCQNNENPPTQAVWTKEEAEKRRIDYNLKYGTKVCCVCCGKELDYRSHHSVISWGNERFEEFTSSMSELQFNEARQNNGRIFDTYKIGIKGLDSLFGETIDDIPQPKDKGVLLKDVLETGVVDRDKSYSIDANYWKGTTLEQYYLKARRQVVFTERRTDEAKKIRREYQKKGKDYSPRRSKELVAREDDKCNCLTTSLTKEHILLDESGAFRKLTPLECMRLQTVPDSYQMPVSDTQRYRMLGNGWTISVISHIFSYLPK